MQGKSNAQDALNSRPTTSALSLHALAIWGLGFRVIFWDNIMEKKMETTIMENHMEKKMENDMATRIIMGYILG